MKCKPEMLAEPKKIWYDESVSGENAAGVWRV